MSFEQIPSDGTKRNRCPVTNALGIHKTRHLGEPIHARQQREPT